MGQKQQIGWMPGSQPASEDQNVTRDHLTAMRYKHTLCHSSNGWNPHMHACSHTNKTTARNDFVVGVKGYLGYRKHHWIRIRILPKLLFVLFFKHGFATFLRSRHTSTAQHVRASEAVKATTLRPPWVGGGGWDKPLTNAYVLLFLALLLLALCFAVF